MHEETVIVCVCVCVCACVCVCFRVGDGTKKTDNLVFLRYGNLNSLVFLRYGNLWVHVNQTVKIHRLSLCQQSIIVCTSNGLMLLNFLSDFMCVCVCVCVQY